MELNSREADFLLKLMADSKPSEGLLLQTEQKCLREKILQFKDVNVVSAETFLKKRLTGKEIILYSGTVPDSRRYAAPVLGEVVAGIKEAAVFLRMRQAIAFRNYLENTGKFLAIGYLSVELKLLEQMGK